MEEVNCIRVTNQPVRGATTPPPMSGSSAPVVAQPVNIAPAALKSVQRTRSVLSLQDDLETAEREFEMRKLRLYKRYLVHTRSPRTARELACIQDGIQREEQQLVDDYNRATAHFFDCQKTTLNRLTRRFNNGDTKALPILQEFEKRIEQRDASTSSFNLQKSRVRLYAAVLHKRLAWMKRHQELQATLSTIRQYDPKRMKLSSELSKIEAALDGRRGRVLRDRTELAKLIQQQATRPPSNDQTSLLKRQVSPLNVRDRLRQLDATLGAAPTIHGYLDVLEQEMQAGLQKPSEQVPYKQAKQIAKHHAEQLAWGADYLTSALYSPANWPVTRRLSLLRSELGNYYAFATEIDPISQIPSTLRTQNGFRTRATNFQKTTFYRLGSQQERVSYRGGQFPTPEAAQQAIQYMVSNGASRIHINSLLTPTALPGNSDRGLLKTHFDSVEAALHPSQADRIIFSNFGVNQGAQGQVAPILLAKWGIKGPKVEAALGDRAAFGWHHATYNYNNQAMERFNLLLKEKLEALADNLNDPSDQDRQMLLYFHPIIQLAKEIQQLWDTNKFASSASDNNPFKMPALLKVMDLMLGITPYVNCMSGKDRTGELEAAAHLELALIEMALEDQQRPAPTRKEIQQAIIDLGYNSQKQWLRPKSIRNIPFLPDTFGIEHHERTTAAVPSNPYLAANRRQMVAGSGAAAITFQNTAYPGSKLKGGTPLLLYGAGFDPSYILKIARDNLGILNRMAIKKAVHLQRLPKDTQTELALQLDQLNDKASDSKITSWLREVAEEMRNPLCPVVKIKH